MDGQPTRLGDLIDDFCPRCKLLLNHAIASFVGSKVAKVICQTCYSEHPFLHGENAKKKPPKGPASAFNQVLAKVTPPPEAAPDPPAKGRPKTGPPARYISRHSARPPRGKR